MYYVIRLISYNNFLFAHIVHIYVIKLWNWVAIVILFNIINFITIYNSQYYIRCKILQIINNSIINLIIKLLNYNNIKIIILFE